MKKIALYDTTLREGSQAAGISFTDSDRKKIIHALDSLGVHYIEIGFSDFVFDALPKINCENSEISVFVSTRRAGEKIARGSEIAALAESRAVCATVWGKASLYQVEKILRTSGEENLAMISDTVKYLKDAGKKVIFDAEHFFSGYALNREYSLSVLSCALDAGADSLALCDTDGGTLPDDISKTVSRVCAHFPDREIGIHCHNDIGLADAGALSAVAAGASVVQCSVSGIGERCGNTSLCTLLPLLQLKAGYDCVSGEQLALLTDRARYIIETANLRFNERAPFVGGYAFAHKAGTHIDAIKKQPTSFEHIPPETVGNRRDFIISGLSGKSALFDKLSHLDPSLTRESSEVALALSAVKRREEEGYTYDFAEGSLALLLYEALGRRKNFFRLENYRVTIDESPEKSRCEATVQIRVGERSETASAEAIGPVNALDLALRRVLCVFYPSLSRVALTDYKVRVLDSGVATSSKVRVFVESGDKKRLFRTIGVSADIIDASWQALSDAMEYYLITGDDNLQ